jgi:thiosulfate dehydrogenase
MNSQPSQSEQPQPAARPRRFLYFLAGLVIGVLIIPAAAYVYFAGGYAPVGTSAPPMPFERYLAHKALHARLAKVKLAAAPIRPTAENLLEGVRVYKQNCAICHGWPHLAQSADAAGMFPRPPQVFHGLGVTDDTPAETHWKAAHGIRLSGMPGFARSLPDKDLWEVSFLLADATNLPPPVQAALSPTNAPAFIESLATNQPAAD